jgi:hypothetical protein
MTNETREFPMPESINTASEHMINRANKRAHRSADGIPRLHQGIGSEGSHSADVDPCEKFLDRALLRNWS